MQTILTFYENSITSVLDRVLHFMT